MLRDWTVARKVGFGFAITVIAIAVLAFTSYRSSQRLADDAAWVDHTHAVQEKLGVLLARLVDAETAVRGYVIAGTEEFLDPWKTAEQDITSTFEEIRKLTGDNRDQQARLGGLKPLIDDRIAQLGGLVTSRRTSPDAAAAEVRNGGGKRAMDKVRLQIEELDREETRLLGERKLATSSARATADAITLWGSLVAILLALLVGWWTASSIAKQIVAAVQQVQSSSTELQAAANQQASSSAEQATAMSEIATTISELLATSRQIAESAVRVSQMAAQTAASANQGQITVGRGNEASGTMRRQVEQIVHHMLALGKKSQQIGSVLDLVVELAEQTNILAINATIEAAGAGEGGRRFGVVADEIRKLADRVTASTREIRALIDDVRGAVNTTVMATEAGSKAVDAGAHQVHETAVAFKQIASLVQTTTDAAREIELSTKQQSTAVEQVNVAIGNIAQAARETEASATQTLQTSVQLTALSKDLRQIVDAGGAHR